MYFKGDPCGLLYSYYTIVNKLITYVNDNLSFRDEYYRIFGRNLPPHKCKCCFHDNTDTPAAAMYDNYMYCFVCHRKYGVYDLLHKYDPSRIQEVSSSVIMPEVQQTFSKNPWNPPVIDYSQSLGSIIHSIIDKP